MQVSGTVATSAGKWTLSALKALQCVSLSTRLYTEGDKRATSHVLKEILQNGSTLYNHAFLKNRPAHGHFLTCRSSVRTAVQSAPVSCEMANNPMRFLDESRFSFKSKQVLNETFDPTITKPSHPRAVFIMGRLKKHSQTVCSLSPRSSLRWPCFGSLQGGLFHWRYQMITYSVFPRVDVVVKASMSHCGGAGFWHATREGSCQSREVQMASIMPSVVSALDFRAQMKNITVTAGYFKMLIWGD